VDDSENRNSEDAAVEKEEDVSAGTPSSEKAESPPEGQQSEDGGAETTIQKEEKAFWVAVGEGAGRTARVLGQGFRGLYKGSGAVMVRTARGVGTGVGKLDAKRRERAAGGELEERRDEIRRQLDQTHAAIGVETAQNAAADGSAVTVGDGLQKLIAREKSLRQELEAAEKAIKERAEAKAVKRASADGTTEPGAGIASATEEAREVESAEPKKKGRGKRPAKEKAAEAPAQAEEDAATAESVAEEEAEGDTNR
jgi:hypothetical protein